MLNGDDGYEQRWDMSPEGGDWAVTIQAPAEPAALWYSFRLTLANGELWLCAAYGGRFGQLMSTRGEGFRLTVYERGFETPEWFRRSVMYQIFPDRFSRDSSGTARRGVERHIAHGPPGQVPRGLGRGRGLAAEQHRRLLLPSGLLRRHLQ